MRKNHLVVWASLGLATLLGLVTTAAVLAGAEGGAPPLGVDWELVAEGFNKPVNIVFTGVPSDTRMFVVEQAGRIKIALDNGTVLPTPFLDITDTVNSETNGEMGLLGLAFAPDYAESGTFYIYYNDAPGDIQVSRYQVSGDPNVALTTSVPILNIPHPVLHNHNGGDLKFGPDGYLYLAPGDGAFSTNAQDLDKLLGKVLRIDVTDVATYTVPASNPFTQTVGARPEIWAYGLRNPWRFSFDQQTGEFYVADVGEGTWEEVNRQPAGSSGQNYGWRCYEGNEEYDTSVNCPISTTLTFPVFVYGHNNTDGGRAVTGGFVYRGTDYPVFNGYYFFADDISRRFWALNTANNQVTALGQMLAPGANPSTFGQSPDGEIYVADLDGGGIYKLTGPTPRAYLPLIGVGGN